LPPARGPLARPMPKTSSRKLSSSCGVARQTTQNRQWSRPGSRTIGRVSPRGLTSREDDQSISALLYATVRLDRAGSTFGRDRPAALRREADRPDGYEQIRRTAIPNSPRRISTGPRRCGRYFARPKTTRGVVMKIWNEADFCRDRDRA